MAAAVQQLAVDPQVWGETSARCLAYIERRYGEDQTVTPYLETLGRLMTGAPATVLA
jgi:hypothetical protein